MAQLEHIEAIEKRLWNAADTLRANSNYASNEYFLPVMGLIFLRHAYSRFLSAREQITANLPTRGGKTRSPTKEDFSGKGAIFLRPHAQFDHLVSLPDGADRSKAILEAMESIEADYESLRGILPKTEYQELDNEVLAHLLRALNPEELKRVSGDVFGRIYEYFLTQFAGEKAHDGGEFFTPVSLVSLIAHILDPRGGIVFDPASGSGGMFVQSARTVQERGENATERLTFYGLEKNATTIRLAKMNLAVHGLEGDIQRAITYYEDPQELLGRVNTLMANPPFNVDEIDAAKIQNDPRLPFGLPGVNKKNKVSNGNYVWISYFWSYLTDTGRAGFVMSSQASSAGRDEAKVRQKLVETGDVDLMIAIRSNFFYTRSVPCELWFFDRAKPAERRDHVLMLDARNIFRKVTRKIFDFSPEQERNLRAIVQLYRGERDGFRKLLEDYAQQWGTCRDALLKPFAKDLAPLVPAFEKLCKACPDYQTAHPAAAPELSAQIREAIPGAKKALADLSKGPLKDADSRHAWTQAAKALAHELKALQKRLDEAQPLFMKENRDACKTHLLPLWEPMTGAITETLQQLHDGLYWVRQQDWLLKRFPEGKYRDVEGLCKRVSRAEIAANDWSLTPGRYVGVAPEEVDEDFDFEETLRAIHGELDDLNEEAVQLAATIQKNFEGLWV